MRERERCQPCPPPGLPVCYVLFKFYNLAGSSGPGLGGPTTNMWKWAGILRLCCELHNDLPPPPPPPLPPLPSAHHQHHHTTTLTVTMWPSPVNRPHYTGAMYPANLVILTSGARTLKSGKAGGGGRGRDIQCSSVDDRSITSVDVM